MKAVGKYIVIDEIKEVKTETKGGLLLAEKQREDIRYREANIVNVGTDVEVVNKDDKIYFDRHAGFSIELDDKIYKVIKEQDIVIIL